MLTSTMLGFVFAAIVARVELAAAAPFDGLVGGRDRSRAGTARHGRQDRRRRLDGRRAQRRPAAVEVDDLADALRRADLRSPGRRRGPARTAGGGSGGRTVGGGGGGGGWRRPAAPPRGHSAGCVSQRRRGGCDGGSLLGGGTVHGMSRRTDHSVAADGRRGGRRGRRSASSRCAVHRSWPLRAPELFGRSPARRTAMRVALSQCPRARRPLRGSCALAGTAGRSWSRGDHHRHRCRVIRGDAGSRSVRSHLLPWPR